MRTLAGPGSQVLFTALPRNLVDPLTKTLSTPKESINLATCTVSPNGIINILKDQNIPLNNVCLLDPKAERELSPEDGNGEFTHFLFGVRSLPFSLLKSHLRTNFILSPRESWVICLDLVLSGASFEALAFR
jgi:Predicted SAM-dependent RNA methyltransferase